MNVLRLSMVFLLAGTGGAPLVAQGQAPDSTSPASDTTTKRPAVVERVATAFSEGDASRLLAPSADRVEISLFGARTYYSSAQALYVLRKFFRSHEPHRFSVRDVMETGTSCFVEGEYEQARVAQRLQVYVRLSQFEGEEVWRLDEVTVELPPE